MPKTKNNNMEELKVELTRLKQELVDKEWASQKTNEGIRILYKELEEKKAELEKALQELEREHAQLKQAEKLASETAWQLKEVIQSVGDGITLSDANGRFDIFNPKMTEITGYTIEEANAYPDFSALIYPDLQDHQKALASLSQIQKDRYCETETTIQVKDGIKKTLLVSTALITHKNREMFLSVYRDITERKRQEEELKKAYAELQKLDQLKDEFVSTVSHELRTPLTTMKEFTSIISDEIPGKLTNDQKEYIDIIKGNIDRLARLINNLLDISKIQAKKMELKKTLVNIETLVKDVVSGLKSKADAKHITMETLFPRVSSDVYIDSDRITQVFTNLIDNAIKFTPEKGKIVVEIKAGKKEIECSVSDTGIGIAPENRDKLFEKFAQIGRTPGPGAKGTGLGLAIIKDLVQLHNGKIWVESELDKGSKFIFTLPKLSSRDIFNEYVNNGVKEAMDKGIKFSIIVISVVNFQKAAKKLGKEMISRTFKDLEEITRKTLRRATDIAIKDTGVIAVLLQDVKKADALSVKNRLEHAIKEYIYQKKDLLKEIQINLGTATFPDEAKNSKDLVDKAKKWLELLYTGIERRKSERKKIELKIGISDRPKDKDVRLDYVISGNLSTEGLGLYTKDKLKPGTKLFISIEIPSQKKPLELEGEVIWSRKEGKRRDLPYRAGIRFVGRKWGG